MNALTVDEQGSAMMPSVGSISTCPDSDVVSLTHLECAAKF